MRRGAATRPPSGIAAAMAVIYTAFYQCRAVQQCRGSPVVSSRACPPPNRRRSPALPFLPLDLVQLTGSAQQGGAEARAQGEGAWEQTKGKATEMGHRAGGCCLRLASLLRIFSPSALETRSVPSGRGPF